MLGHRIRDWAPEAYALACAQDPHGRKAARPLAPNNKVHTTRTTTGNNTEPGQEAWPINRYNLCMTLTAPSTRWMCSWPRNFRCMLCQDGYKPECAPTDAARIVAKTRLAVLEAEGFQVLQALRCRPGVAPQDVMDLLHLGLLEQLPPAPLQVRRLLGRVDLLSLHHGEGGNFPATDVGPEVSVGSTRDDDNDDGSEPTTGLPQLPRLLCPRLGTHAPSWTPLVRMPLLRNAHTPATMMHGMWTVVWRLVSALETKIDLIPKSEIS